MHRGLLLALSSSALALRQPPAAPDAPPFSASNTSWVVVWTGGQSNSIGTNSQPPGEYPTWPTTPLIQSFCWSGKRCAKGTFAPAAVPLFGESNVGFSQTYANLLLQTLPPGTGVILLNTGVGGTGFREGNWVAPSGPLAVQSVAAVKALWDAFPTALGGSNLTLHSMLWVRGLAALRSAATPSTACPIYSLTSTLTVERTNTQKLVALSIKEKTTEETTGGRLAPAPGRLVRARRPFRQTTAPM